MFQNFLKPFYYLNRKATCHILRRALARPADRLPESSTLLYLAASCLPYHISGYTARTQALLESLVESNTKVIALTRPGYPWDRRDSLQTPTSNRHSQGNVDYYHLSTPGRHKQVAHYALRAAAEIEKFARANSIGRIHAASNHANALPGLLAAKHMGIPFQYEMRGLWELSRASRFPSFRDSPGFRMGLELEGFVASRADRLFCISGQLADYASKRWKIDRKKIEVLPNCLFRELAQINPAEQVQPALLGYAGSLVEYEGLDVLLESLAHLRNSGINVSLRVIGDGEARGRLQKLATHLGLDKQVSFLGRMEPESARELLRECAAVCLPRKPYEVCCLIPPFKLVEAMAMAKPLFVPDLPVFREELGELADGWIFEPGNAASLASLLAKRLPDYGLLKAQGEKLREKALSTRQWRNFIPLVLDTAGQ